MNKYIYLSLHRPGNVDDKEKLDKILKSVSDFSKKLDNIKIFFSCHPRTSCKIHKEYQNIQISQPLNYIENLNKIQRAEAIFTDSGGIQEECVVLGVPFLVLRPNTERPEGIKNKCGRILDTENIDGDKIYNEFVELLKNYKKNTSLYGDGDSGKKILSILELII